MPAERISLRLPPDVLAKVKAKAERDGTTPSEVLREVVLRSRLWEQPPKAREPKDAPGQLPLFGEPVTMTPRKVAVAARGFDLLGRIREHDDGPLPCGCDSCEANRKELGLPSARPS